MVLGRVSDSSQEQLLAFQELCGMPRTRPSEARTACRSETNMPLVLILGQPPSRHPRSVYAIISVGAVGRGRTSMTLGCATSRTSCAGSRLRPTR